MGNDLTLNGTCWVYILENDKQERLIGLTGDLQKSIKQRVKNTTANNTTAGKLVFYRCFDDTLSALGFRLLLLKLSESSVNTIVHFMNPENKDLSFVLTENVDKTSKY